MGQRINERWMKEMERQIDFKEPIDFTSSFNRAVQWLIMKLSNAGRDFRLIQLGAGVKRVTTDTTVCPKCNGTGRC